MPSDTALTALHGNNKSGLSPSSLATTKVDIVGTLCKVIDVINRYAGASISSKCQKRRQQLYSEFTESLMIIMTVITSCLEKRKEETFFIYHDGLGHRKIIFPLPSHQRNHQCANRDKAHKHHRSGMGKERKLFDHWRLVKSHLTCFSLLLKSSRIRLTAPRCD